MWSTHKSSLDPGHGTNHASDKITAKTFSEICIVQQFQDLPF